MVEGGEEWKCQLLVGSIARLERSCKLKVYISNVFKRSRATFEADKHL